LQDKVIVKWTNLAEISYENELNFIAEKWTINEVIKFMDLTDNFIKTLEKGVLIGKISFKTKIHSFVISKQTTLFFDYQLDKKTIELLLFWNNSQDPKKLKELLNI